VEHVTSLFHVCGDYCRTKVYESLFRHLAEHISSQIAYCAVRRGSALPASGPHPCPPYQCEVRPILSRLDRALFHSKLRKICRDATRICTIDRVDLVHAHTLYSDGGVALWLKRRYSLPFVVTVRNTDMHVFRRWRPDLRFFERAVLREAARVICLTPAYARKLCASLDAGTRNAVENKLAVIPNGLDERWLSTDLMPPPPKEAWRIICVQDGTKNKNVETLIAAAALLSRYNPVVLTIVGSHKNLPAPALPRTLTIHQMGRVSDWQALAALYGSSHVFAMPSIHESFGIVYLEALSQGLPVLYSRGEGLGGAVEDLSVFHEVDPHDASDIARALRRVLESSLVPRFACRQAARSFVWGTVAQRLNELYRRVLGPSATMACAGEAALREST
jgi:glycosyltransferase involved in cell wall biosynthesis